MYMYVYIYVLLEIFPVSPRGFESFTRRFGSPFGAIFKRGGGRSTTHQVIWLEKFTQKTLPKTNPGQRS